MHSVRALSMATLVNVPCAHGACEATCSSCPETHGDKSLEVYCMRAQGLLKARSSSNYYCPLHRYCDSQHNQELTDADCWNRHLQQKKGAGKGRSSGSPYVESVPESAPEDWERIELMEADVMFSTPMGRSSAAAPPTSGPSSPVPPPPATWTPEPQLRNTATVAAPAASTREQRHAARTGANAAAMAAPVLANPASCSHTHTIRGNNGTTEWWNCRACHTRVQTVSRYGVFAG